MASFIVRLSLLTSSLVAAVASAPGQPCIDNPIALQAAIDALPRYSAATTAASSSRHDPAASPSSSATAELWLCPGIPIETPQPIRIIQRSVRIGCASPGPDSTSISTSTTSTDRQCVLKAQDHRATRLLMIIGGKNENNQPTNTVALHNLRLEGGQVYNDNDDDDNHHNHGGPGGAAVYAQGVNLVVLECQFRNNVATQQGGALAVNDFGRPILFLLQDTSFEDNLNVAHDDCHSIYFHQRHAASTAQLSATASTTTASTTSRQLLDHWDDPAQAASALQAYQPHAGATLCF